MIAPIISLTSFPKRIDLIHHTIKSLKSQKYPYQKIVLWLAESEFKEREVPDTLLELIDDKFVIKWCENLYSYKKLIPSLIEFPDEIIVVCDDDAIYPEDWLGNLVYMSNRYPDCIIASRAHQILMDNEKILSYNCWNQCLTYVSQPAFNIFPTGVGGILLKRSFFHDDITNKKKFLSLAKSNDDFWIWAMATLKGTKCMLSHQTLNFPETVEGTQEYALYKINVIQNANDEILNNIINYYPSITKCILPSTLEDFKNICAVHINYNFFNSLYNKERKFCYFNVKEKHHPKIYFNRKLHLDGIKNFVRKILKRYPFDPMGYVFDSDYYWEERYRNGGNSGPGSYGRLALFKANIINNFIVDNKITDVIEFGCGDGSQLKLYNFTNYIGFEVSQTILSKLRTMNFPSSYIFKHTREYCGEKATLSLSIDVIFYLIDNKNYSQYINRLFYSSTKYVIIYSQNGISKNIYNNLKPRKFTDYVDKNIKDFELIEIIHNQYKEDSNDPLNPSCCDFYIYKHR